MRSLDLLGNTLANNVPGNEWQWANSVANALGLVESALREHRDRAKAPDGLLASVDETRPTLARQADGLRSEHDHFLAQLSCLKGEVRHAAEAFRPVGNDHANVAAGEIPDFGDIRQKVCQLLEALHQNTEAEMCLVLDSINTDIGAGD